jgi:hypothetical protein
MKKNNLPKIEELRMSDKILKRITIVSEGFEQRSLSFLENSESVFNDKIIICRYNPPKKSKYEEMKKIIARLHANTKIKEVVFDRYDPFEFENIIYDEFKDIDIYDEVVLDISVMSKYMIMQLVYSLFTYVGVLRIVYTEPKYYAPTEEKYKSLNQIQNSATILPSFGVHSVIRTPLLTSTVMQKSPILLLTFLSFNEQLIRSLLSECNPMRLFLINGVPPHLRWREEAMMNIHKYIIKEYSNDNPRDIEGRLIRRTSTLDYKETFDLLAKIYSEYCIENRIVLAPTGSKLQALGCALIKICCPDIHIEYPIPESYYIEGYSSSNIRKIHQIVFDNLPKLLADISLEYQLNG